MCCSKANRNAGNIEGRSQIRSICHTTSETVDIDDTEEDVVVVVQQLVHPILFGGDQLMVERSRNIQNVLSTSDTASARLEGIVPVAEDWHAKMCLYKVLLLLRILDS